MTRKEFLRLFALAGLSLPVLGSCMSPRNRLRATDKVIVIGAGAAGLTAAYHLNKRGIEVEVLEAADTYGGRMKRTASFTDFPIPLGAEWLHVERDVFDQIVDDPDVSVDIETRPYDFDADHALISGSRADIRDAGFTIDQKFIGSTWFDFFEEYIVPSIRDRIRTGQVVTAIDHSSDKIRVSTAYADHEADRVIITIPVRMLQRDSIRFTPALPEKKRKAIDKVTVWGGCKAFIEFREKFYPAIISPDDASEEDGHSLYYDAAYGQRSEQNIMGLFAVGADAEPYTSRTDEERIAYILGELDRLFDGKASSTYVRHIFQNWNEEPYAHGAYVQYFESWLTFGKLSRTVDDKLYFAGDAYTDGSDWSSVHAAARSAIGVIGELVG